MEPRGGIVDLKEIDRFLADISEGLSMPIGSVFRIVSQYLKNWGILVTEKNRRWIEDAAAESYLQEWRSGSTKSNDAIEIATVRANLEEGNVRLNARLGEMVVSILKGMYDGKRTFTICDIGSGAGDTIEAVLDAMDFDPDPTTKRLAAFCRFYPIEPSPSRIAAAMEKWEEHKLYKLLPEPPMGAFGNHAYHLPMIVDGNFDIVISNAVFHHIPFPGYLDMIREKLADDGVLIVGDWHTVIWKHPALLVPTLEDLGADQHKIREFKNFFGIKTGDKGRYEATLTKKQREGISYMRTYVKCLAEELAKVGERLFLLEGHEAVEDRVGNIQNAGFETNLPILKKSHRGFKNLEENQQVVFETHDLAAVVAAGKIKPPKKRGTGSRRQQKKGRITR